MRGTLQAARGIRVTFARWGGCARWDITNRMGFFAELKRRNVIRVAGVYIVVGWLLVQVATALEDSLGLPAWFDGTVVALLLLGLPIAVIFAWAFELTPEGVVRTTSVPEGASITAETGRKLDYALAFAIVALVVVIVWQQFNGPEAGTADEAVPGAAPEVIEPVAGNAASVAVLPFEDMSPARDQEYFSEGLSEEILNLLVRAGSIEVASRTSSFQFRNQDIGIPEIARELKVRHVVEGSVRKAGETIRVTAQLIDAANDRHLWSDTYDRPLTVENVFEIQDDVANSIFEALQKELGLGGSAELRAKRTTGDLDAYAMFLEARTLFDARAKLDHVDTLLAAAVEIDPNFAEAWAMRAATQFLMDSYGYSTLPIDELLRRGTVYGERALALDPDSATAIASIANIRMTENEQLATTHDLGEIIDDFTRALEIDPRNASALNWRGLAYARVGAIDLALADFDRCAEVEPYYVPCIENQIWFRGDAGDDEGAMAIYLDSLSTGISRLLYMHLGVLARVGNEIAFKAATNHPDALYGWRRHDDLYRAYLSPDEDHTELAQSIADFFAANPGRSPDFTAIVLTFLGAPLDEMPSGTTPLALWGETGRKFRHTQGFKDYIRKTGAFAYWKQHGFPATCRPRGDDDFECD